MPRWKLVRRSLAWSADRAGAVPGIVGIVTPPGTRFAFGTRLGRPARVVPEDTGACATSAACHPSSAGDDQPAELGSRPRPGADHSPPRQPRRNQSHSTDSNSPSRLSPTPLALPHTGTPARAGRSNPRDRGGRELARDPFAGEPPKGGEAAAGGGPEPGPDPVPGGKPADPELPHPPGDRHIRHRRVVQPPVGMGHLLG